MSRLDIDLSVSYIGNESCVGLTFTYYFPILVVKNDTIFPAKLPKNWGPTIINIVISGVLCLVSLVIYIWAKKKLNEYLELLENQKVEEKTKMATLLYLRFTYSLLMLYLCFPR